MPARLSKIRSAARNFGIEITTPRSGSHWKARKATFRTYSIPAHNGLKTEISDRYIEGLCRNFELDLDEFKEEL